MRRESARALDRSAARRVDVYTVNIHTFVLVSGAGGNGSYWNRVAPLLRDAGYGVVAPDLPAGDDRAGIDEYAGAVVAAVGDATGLAVVGQSLGAHTAAAVCDRVPVELLVFVGGMLPKVGETAGEWWEATGQPAAKRRRDVLDGRDPDAPWDDAELFYHDVPPAVLAEVLAEGEPAQSFTPFDSPFTATSWQAVPTRVIAGKLDRLFPFSFMSELALQRLGVDVDPIDSGHLPALSRPGDLARLLVGYAEGTR